MSQTNPYNATQALFDLIIARPVAAPDLQHGRLVHIQWTAPDQGDRLVQFYVNGELNDHSASSTAREAWLLLDMSIHNEIELLAIEPDGATKPQVEALDGTDPGTRPMASFALIRDHAVPIDSTLALGIDSEGLLESVPLFSADTPRGGFGAVFGEGGFGFDASTGLGLGIGELGYGPLGADGDALHWHDDSLTRGDHTLNLSLEDQAGNSAASAIDLVLTVTRLPTPPTDVTLHNDLNLTWN